MADFPAAIFLAGIACRAAGKLVNSSVESCRKIFHKGVSERHSLLEFSDYLVCFALKALHLRVWAQRVASKIGR